MKNRKIFTFILTAFLCTIIGLTPVLGLISVMSSYTTYGTVYTAPADIPGFAIGQVLAGNGQYLYSTVFWIKDSNTATGVLQACVYWQNGSSYVLLENSTNTLDLTSANVNATGAWQTFTFTGTTQVESGKNYWFTCENTGVQSQALEYGENTGSGGRQRYGWGEVVGDASCTFMYYVYTNSEGLSTPAPTASPGPLPTGGSYDTSNTNAVITALFGYLVPLLLWLIPAGLLGWLTHWAKWPLLIGLAIGGGLCYLFLGTQYIWMIMVTLIGLVGMAYSDYQGGRAQ